MTVHGRGESRLASWMVEEIISQEPKAERSLMHRFNIALVSPLPSHPPCPNPSWGSFVLTTP